VSGPACPVNLSGLHVWRYVNLYSKKCRCGLVEDTTAEERASMTQGAQQRFDDGWAERG